MTHAVGIQAQQETECGVKDVAKAAARREDGHADKAEYHVEKLRQRAELCAQKQAGPSP